MQTHDSIRFVIADDHNIFREGLKKTLSNSNLLFIGEATNGKQLLKLIEKQLPDVVLADIDMPLLTGIEVTRIVSKKYPSVRMIILSMYDDPVVIKEAIIAGAKGYLLKGCSIEELIRGIENVMKGRYCLPSLTKNELFELLHCDPKKCLLTTRETEVVRLMFEEMTSNEISEQLHISERTVEDHRKKISRKIGAKNIVGIIKYALRNRIVKSTLH